MPSFQANFCVSSTIYVVIKYRQPNIITSLQNMSSRISALGFWFTPFLTYLRMPTPTSNLISCVGLLWQVKLVFLWEKKEVVANLTRYSTTQKNICRSWKIYHGGGIEPSPVQRVESFTVQGNQSPRTSPRERLMIGVLNSTFDGYY